MFIVRFVTIGDNMAFFNIKNSKILAMAASVPDDLERTTDYYQYFDKNYVDKFIESTGVESRYTSHRNGVTASDLCFAAAEKVLNELDYDRDKIDAVLFMSSSRDYLAPVTACILQSRLGLSKDCLAYDVPLGCSAYVYGLYIATTHINAGCRSVLLLAGSAGDRLSSDFVPSEIPMLHGSAGSATLIEYNEDSEDIFGLLRSNGDDYKMLVSPFGGQRHSFWKMVDDLGVERAVTLNNAHYMDGMDVMRFSLTDVVKMIKDFQKHFVVELDDFDILAAHQANKLIIKSLSRKIKLSMDKIPLSIDKYGNTGCGSIPLAICEHYKNMKDKPSKAKIATCGFGIGLSLGIVGITIEPEKCFGILKVSERFDDGISYDIFD